MKIKVALICIIGLLITLLFMGCNKSDGKEKVIKVQLTSDEYYDVPKELGVYKKTKLLTEMPGTPKGYVMPSPFSPVYGEDGSRYRAQLREQLEANGVSLEILDPMNRYRTYEFANNFFDKFYKKENFVVSPIGLYIVLSLLYEGGEGNTKAELSQVLTRNTEDYGGLHRFVEDFFVNDDFEMSDCIYINKKVNFEKSFLDLAENHYYGLIKSYSENPVKDINDWVNKKTYGRIPVMAETIDSNSVMSVLNGNIYKGSWIFEFNGFETGNFIPLKGKSKKVEYMKSYYGQNVFNVNGGYIYRVPTMHGSMFCFILPPKGQNIKDYMKELDFGNIKMLYGSEDESWNVLIPKFEIESKIDLRDVLKSMGINNAFDKNQADFSNIVKNKGVWVSSIQQNTKIKIDEKGFEKRDVAAEVEQRTNRMLKKKTLVFGRPFGFVVLDFWNSYPLFMGCVYDPAK